MSNCFENVKKNFGFGCMRFPMINDKEDIPQIQKMIDEFIEAGFNYFDTAHVYHGGRSETILKECLTSRYPRDKFILTDKLSNSNFTKEEELEPLLDSQLEACGVEYFDFYLMHAQSATLFEKYKKCKAYEFAFRMKEKGKVKHVGISFHDSAEVLDQILTEYPQIEAVQIQFNYLDYENPSVQSRLCYEVCRKHNKPVIIMEPVKGGSLVNLPEDADQILRRLNGGSNASYAIRFAAHFDGIAMVLSGMSNLEQLRDNISFMKDYQRLTDVELNALKEVIETIKSKNMIACTSCRYCVDGCPKNILIPDLFGCYNSKKFFRNWNADMYYFDVHTKNHGKASDCIKCGKCEFICPQKLPIRDLLVKVVNEFEKR